MTQRTESLYDVDGLFRATDDLDAESYGRFMADEASVTFANNPPVVGRPAIVEFVRALFDSFDSLHHELLGVWNVDDIVIVRMEITFGIPGGQSVTLPAAAISQVTGGLITSHQVYVNDRPLAE